MYKTVSSIYSSVPSRYLDIVFFAGVSCSYPNLLDLSVNGLNYHHYNDVSNKVNCVNNALICPYNTIVYYLTWDELSSSNILS